MVPPVNDLSCKAWETGIVKPDTVQYYFLRGFKPEVLRPIRIQAPPKLTKEENKGKERKERERKKGKERERPTKEREKEKGRERTSLGQSVVETRYNSMCRSQVNKTKQSYLT